jgi:hypothetical protein
MPCGDGTGPAGLGPMTGRAAGFCAGYPVPGFMNPVGGRGFWGWGRDRGFRGRGGGRGWRNSYYATGPGGLAQAGWGYPWWGAAVGPYAGYGSGPGSQVTAQQELAGLKEQAKYFQSALEDIQKRITEMEQEGEK